MRIWIAKDGGGDKEDMDRGGGDNEDMNREGEK